MKKTDESKCNATEGNQEVTPEKSEMKKNKIM